MTVDTAVDVEPTQYAEGKVFDEGQPEGGLELADESKHTVGQDSPYEVGFHLCSAIDNAFILGYAFLVMAFTGWWGGALLFGVGWCITYYANILLTNLTIIEGVRYVRFRDIGRKAYGTFGMWFVVIPQWININAGNIGLMILGGQALKGIDNQYGGGSIHLTAWIFIACGIAILCTLAVYDLHQLRYLSAVSAACIVFFASITIGIAAHDGATAPEPRDYSLPFDHPSQIFNAMGSVATVAFAYTNVIQPEIQATVRPPVIKNFYISLAIQYFCGAPLFIIMAMVSYWAYGNEVEINVIYNLSGPAWAITVAWVAVFIQVIVSLQIYAFPVYELIDTRFGKEGGPWTPWNLMIRIVFRTAYIGIISFVAALLPFFGDFVALTGALSVLPLSFAFTFLLHVHFNGGKMKMLVKLVHWGLAVLFALLTIMTAIASIRFIVVDSINYSVFANIG